MSKQRDPRLAPLRRIVSSYPEPADGGAMYDLLECGHSKRQDDLYVGAKRRRCDSCKWEALRPQPKEAE